MSCHGFDWFFMKYLNLWFHFGEIIKIFEGLHNVASGKFDKFDKSGSNRQTKTTQN